MWRDQLQPRIDELSELVPIHAEALGQALAYASTDAQSSLTKSRSVLEKLTLEWYEREVGGAPKKPMLGEMLNQRRLTEGIERRILSRMHSIRDMGNLGPHGEAVDESDAVRVLTDLCDVLEYYARRYQLDRSGPVVMPAAALPRGRKPIVLGVVALVIAAGVALALWLVLRGERATGAAREVVTLSSPLPAANFRATPIALRWQPAGAGVTYEVEVSRVDSSGRLAGAPASARVPLTYIMWPWDELEPAPGPYSWRVRIDGGKWSSARSFTFYASILDRVIDTGVLRVGMEMTYHRPFAYFDVDSQELVGFDVDLAKAIAQRLGVERKGVALVWDELFTAVDDDRIDVVISAVTITAERAQRFAFSRPYFVTGQRLTARANDRRAFAGGAGFVIGTQKGTSSATAARAIAGADVRLFATLDLAVAALSSHEVDLLVCDEAISPALVGDGFRFAGPRLTEEGYGVMMRADDSALRTRLDAIVAELAAAGELDRLGDKYGVRGE